MYKKNSAYKHGECLGGKHSRLFDVWSHMIRRVTDPKDKRYKDYGGRGITVCEEWKDSTTFFIWARSHGYADNLILDRIKVNNNYCPENCRFVTPSISSINRRKSRTYNIYKNKKRYYIRVRRDKQRCYLGSTSDLESAIILRDKLLGKFDLK